MKKILLLFFACCCVVGCSSGSNSDFDSEVDSDSAETQLLLETGWRLVEAIDSSGESLAVPIAVNTNNSDDLLGILLGFANRERFNHSYFCQGVTAAFSLNGALMQILEFGILPVADCAPIPFIETQAQGSRLDELVSEVFASGNTVVVDISEERLILMNAQNSLLQYVPFNSKLLEL